MTDSSPADPVSKPIASRIREFPAIWFFGIWFLLALAATIPFWLAPVKGPGSQNLDIILAIRWLHDSGPDFWPHENDALWRFFYHAAPILVGVLGLSGLAMAFAGVVNERWLYLRPMGLYLLLTVAMGPGLFVNAIGKEYAGRPRPRQVFEVRPQLSQAEYEAARQKRIADGTEVPYLAPFQFGKPGAGKSFPCGHCSVGFSFAALWLLVRRKNLWLGRAALTGGLGLGMVMGVGRMAAGAHFFSDVLWAGLMTMLAAGISYYYIMRMPARWAAWASGATGTGGGAAAATRTRGQKAREGLVFGVVGGLLVFCLLLASPVHEDPSYERKVAGENPAVVVLKVDAATTRIVLTSGDAPAIAAQARIRGFGLPSNKVRLRGSLDKEGNTPYVTVELTRKGLFTDYEGNLELRLNTDKVRQVEITQPAGALILPANPPSSLKIDDMKVSASVPRSRE